VYLRARYYDPTTGQFLTRDPLEAQTQQPYSYANDNPVNNTDPSGLWLGISWLPSPGQAINFVVNHAKPIGEGALTVGACAVPGIDIVSCSAAILGVADFNVASNDIQEYQSALQGCSASPYLNNDVFELATAGVGLGVAATVNSATSALNDLAAPSAGSALSGARRNFGSG